MIDKTMNWTAPLGWTPCYGDYMSGQSATDGGEDVTCEGLRYTNGTLRMGRVQTILSNVENGVFACYVWYV